MDTTSTNCIHYMGLYYRGDFVLFKGALVELTRDKSTIGPHTVK